MYGSILGDIAGSRYEFSKPKHFHPRRVELFSDKCFYTDDTVMTIATKYAVYNRVPYASAYVKFGRKYPLAGYGNLFKNWLYECPHTAYNSYGNGSAMRVSFLGRHFQTLERVREEARKSAMCTHNHPEGIKGAQATAVCVYLCRMGASKREIKRYMEKNFGYALGRPLLLRRPGSRFDVTCQVSVPLAIRCFLESDSWEDCIRKVFSILCDTDTVSCIAGGFADAFYGGTGFDEDALLRRYLIGRHADGAPDRFLYEWAAMPMEEE